MPVLISGPRSRTSAYGLERSFDAPRASWRIFLKLVVICVLAFGIAEGAPTNSRREAITKLVVKIQRADFEGDRAALKRLFEDLGSFSDDKELGAKVRYWRGFAMWRRALNGFNDSVDRSELEQDLEQAVSEFDEAVAKDPGFVDAKVGAGSSLLNLVFLYQKDPARVSEFLAKAVPLLKEAGAAEPQNPRYLWVRGASLWYLPPERGGGQDKAIDTYQQGLKLARDQKSMPKDSLTPSWGEPELLMNLAWSNLNRSTPDLTAAEQYARSALVLVPYWHYVKDILLPQIVAARAKLTPTISTLNWMSGGWRTAPGGGPQIEEYWMRAAGGFCGATH